MTEKLQELRRAAKELREGVTLHTCEDGIPGTGRGPCEIHVNRYNDEYYTHVLHWHTWAAPERSVGLGWHWSTPEVDDFSSPVLADVVIWLADTFGVQIL